MWNLLVIFSLAFLLNPWHFSKGQCADHYHFKNRFKNISQRKMKQILQESFFMIFFREVWNKIEKVYSSLTEIILAQNFMGENIACTILTSTVCFNPNGWSDSEQFWKAFHSWFITLKPASKHLKKAYRSAVLQIRRGNRDNLGIISRISP